MAIAIITSNVQQFLDSGAVNNGGSITVYAAGTTTPLTLYSNDTLLTTTANPIVLDSAGRHAMTYIAAGTAYKLLVKNSSGSTLYTRDNIDPGVAVGSGALPVASGGTGATTAGGARTNLGVPSQGEVDDIASDVSDIQTALGTTGWTEIATGTTAQGVQGTEGRIRWDTDYDQPTVDNGAAVKKVVIEGKGDFGVMLAAGGGVACLQRSTTISTTTRTSAITTPAADTSIPQIGEGADIPEFNVNFTPVHASSEIRVRLILALNINAAATAVVALFKDAAAGAVAGSVMSNGGSAGDQTLSLEYSFSPGSVVQINFQLRFGTNAGTISINSAASTLGGVKSSRMIIEEWLTP